MKTCSECGHEYSNTAESCPNCGKATGLTILFRAATFGFLLYIAYVFIG